MILYLARHAKAKSDSEDPTRSLSDEGIMETEKLASFLIENCRISAVKIYHSGKKRAAQTAEILARAAGAGVVIEKAPWLSPGDDVSEWLKRLNCEEEDIMLVGHLPYMEKLASALLCGDENIRTIAFNTATVACLERTVNGTWFINWVVYPGMLRHG